MRPDQLGRLVDEHSGALVLYARQWCAAPEAWVQEAFLTLMPPSPPPEQLLPWLYRVARNAAISACRASLRRRRHEAIAAQRAPAWFAAPEGAALDARTAT